MSLSYYVNWSNAHKARKTRGFSEGGFVGAELPDLPQIGSSLVNKKTSKNITQETVSKSVGQKYMDIFAKANEEYLVADSGNRVVTRDPNIKVPSSALSDEALQDEMVAMLSSGNTKRDNKGLDVRATKTEPLDEFTFNFIVDREGFESTPYDDSKKGSKKPVWRAGFGSDTYTKEDGTVVTVKQDSFVSKEDAIRDLTRRIKTEFMPRAKRSVGSNTWNTLGESTQTALTSYVYNYGNIGESIIKAANSGSTRKLADAVRARAVDNKGVNSNRRNEEADLIESDMSGQEILASTRKRNK